MSELTLLLLRLALLVLLWAFVLLAVGVMRRDLFGARPTRAARKAARAAAAPRPPAAPVTTSAPTSAAKAPRNTPRSLVVTAGSGPGRVLTLGTVALTIGRAADNSLVVEDDYASSHHCRLVPGPAGWTLEDLGSTNGTFVGKSRVTAPVPVKAGSTFKVGRTVLELRK
jgi:pSer/pThr/pTyr-binding forkhead associated (FHA) protein